MKSLPVLLLCLALAATPPLGAQNLPPTREQQEALTPDNVLSRMMEGNARYVLGRNTEPNVTARIAAAAAGQYPKAVVLSCLDSRVPVEEAFDFRIGDVFVARVAGNVENDDILGSLEFATKLSGAKLIMVLGHSNCGAIRGACDGAELGHLTGLLARIHPAIEAVKGFEKQRNSGNGAFVEAVIQQNVRLVMANIRGKSPIISEMEKAGEVRIVGGVYDLSNGRVTLLGD